MKLQSNLKQWSESYIIKQGSSERSERSVRFNPNLRSERVRYFSEREVNLQALKAS